MSKADLQERARELDIDGRSKMSETELEAAIAQAEGRPAAQTEGADAAAALTAAARTDETVEPLTPEQTGRPELIDVATSRAKNRRPHRVIGATPDTDTQEA